MFSDDHLHGLMTVWLTRSQRETGGAQCSWAVSTSHNCWRRPGVAAACWATACWAGVVADTGHLSSTPGSAGVIIAIQLPIIDIIDSPTHDTLHEHALGCRQTCDALNTNQQSSTTAMRSWFVTE